MSTSTFTVQACYDPSPYEEEGQQQHQQQADNEEEEDLIPPPPPPPPAYLDHHRHGPPSYEQHRLRSRHGFAEDYHCHQYSGSAPFHEQQKQQQGHHYHYHHYEDPHHGLPPPPSYSSTFSAKEEGPILPDPPEWTALRPPFPSAVSSHNRNRNYFDRATSNSSSPSSSSFGYNILPPPAWRAMPPTSAPPLPPQAPPPFLAHHHACGGDRPSTSASTPPPVLTPIWCSDPESLQSNRDLLDSVGLNPEANYNSSALLWRCDPRILQHAFYDCSPSPQHPTPKVWSMPLDVEYSQQQELQQEEDDTRSDPSSTRSSAQHDACALHTQQQQQQKPKAQMHPSKVTIYLIAVDEVQSIALPDAAVQLPPPFYKTNQPQRSLNRTANCRIGGVNIDFPQPEIALANVVHFLTGVQMEEVEAFRARAGLGITRFVQKENNSSNNKTSLRALSVEASMALLATIDDRLWMAPCTPEFTGFFYAPTDLAAAELRARIEVMVQKAASASAPAPLPTSTPPARINNKNSQLSTQNPHHHYHDHDSKEEDQHQRQHDQNQSRRRVVLRFPRHFVNFSSWEVRSRPHEKKHDKKTQKEEHAPDGEPVEPDQANALQDCMTTKE